MNITKWRKWPSYDQAGEQEYKVIEGACMGQTGKLADRDFSQDAFVLVFKTHVGASRYVVYHGHQLQWVDPEIKRQNERARESIKAFLEFSRKSKGYEFHNPSMGYNEDGLYDYCDDIYDIDKVIDEFLKINA